MDVLFAQRVVPVDEPSIKNLYLLMALNALLDEQFVVVLISQNIPMEQMFETHSRGLRTFEFSAHFLVIL